MALSAVTKAWLHGLGAAFVGGGAAVLTTALSAPESFNFTTGRGLRNLAISALVAGIGASAAFLLKSPLPGAVTVVQAQQTVATPEGTTTTTTSAVKTE